MEANPDRNIETQKNKVNRLSKLDAQKKLILQEEIHKEFYDRIKFKPKINSISKVIGKHTKAKDMADNSGVLEHKRRIKEEIEKKKLKECSFKP